MPYKVLIMMSFFIAHTFCNVYYVKSDISEAGDGASWLSPFRELPPKMERGAIYYIASGEYSGNEFNTPEESTKYIVIKKATILDHGTDIGWENSYGDGQVVFTDRLSFTTGYWEIDGQTGGGPNNWSGDLGIKVIGNWSKNDKTGRVIFIDQNDLSNFKFKHLELCTSTPFQGFGHVFYGFNFSNVEISHCYAHHIFGCFLLIRSCKNLLVEYSYFKHNSYSAELHSEFCSDIGTDSATFRYNLLDSIQGTAVFAGVNGTVGDDYSDHWNIYGNIVHSSDPFIEYYPKTAPRYWKVFNNTISSGTGKGKVYFADNCGVDIEVSNNIWYNFPQNGGHSMTMNSSTNTNHNSFYDVYFSGGHNVEGEGNTFDYGNPFVGNGFDNFDLSKNANHPGKLLEAPYNEDMFGVKRGIDGLWDRGALERSDVDKILEFSDEKNDKEAILIVGNEIKITTKDTGTVLFEFYTLQGRKITTIKKPLEKNRVFSFPLKEMDVSHGIYVGKCITPSRSFIFPICIKL